MESSENVKGKRVKIPPYVKIVRDVTDETFYSIKNLANIDFEMEW